MRCPLKSTCDITQDITHDEILGEGEHKTPSLFSFPLSRFLSHFKKLFFFLLRRATTWIFPLLFCRVFGYKRSLKRFPYGTKLPPTLTLFPPSFRPDPGHLPPRFRPGRSCFGFCALFGPPAYDTATMVAQCPQFVTRTCI